MLDNSSVSCIVNVNVIVTLLLFCDVILMLNFVFCFSWIFNDLINVYPNDGCV